ncbi:integrase [Faecalispora jeddahensis]|uniref:tyrosine-type recombinase/integrase n=1 Tax=Faecalispora jeddahensis TaxID=1414721 RepID=UPI0027BB0D85|nr:integrase [Faecalispora jeddahensis]
MPEEKDMTVGVWAEQWFTQRVGKWNPNTEGGYRNLICNHIIPGVGRAVVSTLTARRIQSFYKRLAQNGLSARSVWCVHLLLRRCLDEACRDGQIPLNPARLCSVPQTEEHQTIPLRLGQLQRYLNAAEELGTLPIIYTGLTSGLRQCELLTLSWADFYVPCRYIRKGKRLLALNDKASALLADLPLSELTTVFLNAKTGEPYRLHEFYYLHKRILKEARLPWVAFRDLQRQCMEVGI